MLEVSFDTRRAMVSNANKAGVVRFENLISATKNNSVEISNEELSDKEESNGTEVPRGKCKSGKFWKSPKTRFKTIVKTKGLRLSLEKRRKIQEEITFAKQLTRNALVERKRQKEEHRLRRQENLKKKKENERKSEVVQVIKNPSKIKKKHLRMIEKRDTLPLIKKKVD